MNTFTSDAHSNAILESISAKLIRAREFADSRSIIEAQTKQAREMTASSRKELVALQASVGVIARKRKHADENDAPIDIPSTTGSFSGVKRARSRRAAATDTAVPPTRLLRSGSRRLLASKA
ncbi:hypothetical protein B0H16DRAFT_1899323 [Mycena metata]|uniref:Uncharacterized protein n=1 Tax=Mycena metata TaxID=1033252 RepID=A0AAD7H6U4_9AGAR|nr:hypothetical protein B0H16DRAFT_1899323 [Mycena metata]